MIAGEIKIEGLGKRYWFRSLTEDTSNREPLDQEDDPEAEEEETPLAFFRRPMSEVWALRDFSLHIQAGERLGIIGGNGSGKSTLIRILSRALPPSEGKIVGAGIVIPFASLSGALSADSSGCDNLRMLARLLGIPLDHLEERLPAIVEFSELGRLAYEKVSRYSDRSFARLSMAMALFVDASIYLIDDDLKVGDESYRLKFYDKFSEVLKGNATLCYASNKLHSVREYCDRAVLLNGGRKVAEGEVNSVIRRFLATSDEAIDLDEIELIPDRGHFEDWRASKTVAASTSDHGNRKPLLEWAEEVWRADTAWEKLIDRWREKTRSTEGKSPICSYGGASSKGAIHSLTYYNAEGHKFSQCLPGEDVFLELLLECFEVNSKIEVRLEMYRANKLDILGLTAEPLLPLVASKPGLYLFRVEMPGTLMASANECAQLKFVLRVYLSRPGTSERDRLVVKSHFDVRGDLRFQFDEQRFLKGQPATTIIEPTPTFTRFPVEDRDRPLNAAEASDGPPAIRPRLNWMIYHVTANEDEAQRELLHEDL